MFHPSRIKFLITSDPLYSSMFWFGFEFIDFLKNFHVLVRMAAKNLKQCRIQRLIY